MPAGYGYAGSGNAMPKKTNLKDKAKKRSF